MTRPKSRDRLRGRNGIVWQSYLAGATQDQIAAAQGITQSRVSQIITEVRESIPAPVVEEIVAVERDRIARLYQATMEILAARHPLVSLAKGVIVRDEDGAPLEDAGPKLAAINTAMRIHERVSKLYGLDAPERVEATVTREPTRVELDWQEFIAEAKDKRRQARAALENEAAGVRAIGAAS